MQPYFFVFFLISIVYVCCMSQIVIDLFGNKILFVKNNIINIFLHDTFLLITIRLYLILFTVN